ncbi:MAG TPA: acyl-CoA carboxylase subunit epsilon [Micromonosporaceae bacterium]|nr:acyl-CoA carboxylase subunit epsilon [Micromonosporaceae bacterium]
MTATDNQRGASFSLPIALVRGDATTEEVAALMLVLTSVAGSARANEPAARRTSIWVEHARQARRPLGHGAGAWRSSALPR